MPARDPNSPRPEVAPAPRPAAPNAEARPAPPPRSSSAPASSNGSAPEPDLVEVLALCPQLAEGLPAELCDRARRHCTAPALILRPGPWQPPAYDDHLGGFGLLVLDGLLVRKIDQVGACGAELLGDGDLLRPWQRGEEGASVASQQLWSVLSETRLAVLDHRFARRAAPFPTVAVQLVARAISRSRRLAAMIALVSHPRVDQRLHLLFWHLADRWGRMGPVGALLDLPLTHQLLGDLVAARRPTVSRALSRLAAEEKVERTRCGWLLRGEPPTHETYAEE
jgi:CRP/FNR family transcriptional regulator, cyclic AMP receptor protein